MSTRRTSSTDAVPSAPPDPDGRLQVLHDRLQAAVGELTSATGWRQMLRTATALPAYSPHNVLLIASQRPDARAVAGFHAWKQLGRSVRKGEKGISILAPVLRRRSAEQHTPATPATEPTAGPAVEAQQAGPSGPSQASARRVTGFRIVHVFDISQTDGPDLPEPPRPVRLDGDAPPGLIDGLSEQIRNHGFELIRRPLDDPEPGCSDANGITDFCTRTVLVRPELSDAQTAKTLAHELGHVLLHAPDARPPGLTREQVEVEAESVAYVVTATHGLDSSTYSVNYVAGWAGADLTLVARTAERVLTTANGVLQQTAPAPTQVLLVEGAPERVRDRQPMVPATRSPSGYASAKSALRRTAPKAAVVPGRAVTREPLPAGVLADRSRLTTRSRLTSQPPGSEALAGGHQVPGRAQQGRLR